jgi:tetratricopeptide (TPR) repeat protein
MHTLIAFLAFVFSPAEDWTLKQAFALFIDPQQLEASVDQAEKIAKTYPTVFETPAGPLSADAVNSVLWSDILAAHQAPAPAHALRLAAARDAKTPSELREQLQLKAGETALALGRLDEAKEFFEHILTQTGSPYALDAHIDLLVCALRQNDLERAKALAEEIESTVGADFPVVRAHYPLGLTAFALNDFAKAKTHFEAMGDDARGLYFLGLSLRKLDRPHEALQAWQQLKRIGRTNTWTELASAQVVETYFALGDDALCRSACETSLAQSRDARGAVADMLRFRLAAVDMRTGRYEQALSRLQELQQGPLAKRSHDVLAEALIQTNRRDELLALQHERKPSDKAEALYQTAWASMFSGKAEPAAAIAQRGLETFFDADYTPRLLLLQGLAFEHLGKEAEALATYQTVMDRFPNTHAAAQSTHWLTLAYLRLGRAREAVTHGTYAWSLLSDELKRDHPDTAYWLGEAHLKLDRVTDADGYLQNFIAMAKIDNPLLMNAQFQRSVTLAKLNRPAEALAMLDQFSKTAAARKQTQWIAYAQQQRGNIYFNQKQYAQAVASYRGSAGSTKGIYYAGLALYHMEYYTDATAAWSQLAAQRPHEPLAPAASFRSARTQFELGQTTTAVNSFIQFAMAYPYDPSAKAARLQAGHALFNAGKLDDAAPYYADYLKRYPTSDDMANVTPYLAACYAHLGKSPADADRLMRGLPPTDVYASLRWDQGAEKFNAKKADESSQLFGELAFDEPANENAVAARFYRGENMFAQKNWRDAELAFAGFIAAAPNPQNENLPVALFHKGVAQFNQDKLLKAAGTFQTLADGYPSHPLAHDAVQNMLVCYNNLGQWDKRDQLQQRYNAPPLVAAAPAAEPATAPAATAPAPANRTVAEIDPAKAPLLTPKQEEMNLAQAHAVE